MKEYRITGKSNYRGVVKHRFKDTDSKEEAKEIYERFCSKYYRVRLFVNGIFTDPSKIFD